MATLVALVFLPGFVILLAARVRLPLAAAGAIPASYGVVTIAAMVFGATGIAWNLGSYLGATAVTALVLGLVALVVARPWRRWRGHGDAPGATVRLRWWQRLRRWDWRAALWCALPALAVCAAAWAIGTMILNELSTTPGGVANVLQTWDSHWHANYLRFIADTGIAAPDKAGLLRNPESGATLYYPSSWHAIAALVYTLTGVSVSETYNLVQIGGHALFFPLGVAALAYGFARRRCGLPVAATAATLGAILTPLFPSMPFVEIMIAATPSSASIGLTGVVVLLIMEAVRRPIVVLPAGLGLIGVGGVHPSGLATTGIIIIFYWLFELLWRPERSRLRDFLSLAAVAIIGAVTLIPQLVTISTEADDIASFEFQTGDSRAADWGKAAALQVRHVEDWGFRWVLLALIILGAVVLLYRMVWWPILLWAGYLVVEVNAMQVFGNWVGGWLRAAGSIYYNDPRRLGLVMAVITAAAASFGVAMVAQGLVGWLARLAEPITDPRGTSFHGLRVAAALAGVIAIGSWSLQTSPEYAVAAGTNQRWGLLVDSHDLAAFNWLATQPHAYDGMIFVNNEEGSGWMYATNGLPSTARHFLDISPPEKNVGTLWRTIDRAGESASTDRAIAELGVNYVYFSPGNYWWWQRTPEAFYAAESSPGLVPIYVDRQIRIYAVRKAFSNDTIQQMIANSPHPPGAVQQFTRASEHGY